MEYALGPPYAWLTAHELKFIKPFNQTLATKYPGGIAVLQFVDKYDKDYGLNSVLSASNHKSSRALKWPKEHLILSMNTTKIMFLSKSETS